VPARCESRRVERADIVYGNARTEEFHGIDSHWRAPVFTKFQVRCIWEDVLQRNSACAQVVAFTTTAGFSTTRSLGNVVRGPVSGTASSLSPFPALFSVPYPEEDNLEKWSATDLASASTEPFKTYTEKVWECPAPASGPNGLLTDQRTVCAPSAKCSVRRGEEA
jgi:hypothetical protein